MNPETRTLLKVTVDDIGHAENVFERLMGNDVAPRKKFITDYEVYEKQLADCELTESVIERHQKLFGTRPEVVAADKGFCPAEAKFQELAEQVETLAIPRRMQDFVDKVLAHWQAFRAGIEGTISGLKRAFRLIRCFFRGFRSFTAAVGLGVFCHNLIVLADHASH